jgi:hypothetical protein
MSSMDLHMQLENLQHTNKDGGWPISYEYAYRPLIDPSTKIAIVHKYHSTDPGAATREHMRTGRLHDTVVNSHIESSTYCQADA